MSDINDLNLTLRVSPHIHGPVSVPNIMGDVVLALMPAGIAGVYFFGFTALRVILLSVLSCVVAEYLWQKVMKRPCSIGDLSAVVTGLLLAYNLPPTVPSWLPVVGGVFAIVVVKQFFGGIGQNIVNPALATRAALLASWPVHMTTWTLDGVSTATPLTMLKYSNALPDLGDLFLGNVGGCLGETSVLALLLGGLWLLYRKVISWHIPVTYIATVAVLTLLLGRNGFMNAHVLYEVCAGGLMLGAIFMATDYTTSPATEKGQVIFAVGCGVLCTVIRLYGSYNEGVSYSILIMNLFVPMIDKFVKPKVFGKVA